jgi:DNA-binding response OmpR family regulator
MMPGMGGWSTLQAIQNHPELSSIPIIITSMLDDRELGMSLGASEYLEKPLERGKLSDAVKRCVRQRHDNAILIVEDNPEVAGRLAESLAIEGWDTILESTAEASLNILQSRDISLIILDLATPELDGYELVEFVRSNSKLKELPIIGLTLRDQFFKRPDLLASLSVTRINKYELDYSNLEPFVRSLLEQPSNSDRLESASRIA